MEIIIATNNQGKVREIKNRLTGYEVYSLKDKEIEIEVEEDGTTFEENAIKKARAVADLTGILTMADDSGLEVFALDNAPGIYSARYGGEGLDDTQRYEKLLKDMEGKANRGARFVSVIALCYPNGRNVTLRGECYGEITTAPKGPGGFGYDPVFYYPPLNQTFGEISLEDKNKISHRARALDNLERFFKNQNSILENEQLRLEVSALGGEIQHLIDKKSGKNLMNTDRESWDFVAPVLFPILGRQECGYYVYEHGCYKLPAHGFARYCVFSLVSQNEHSVTYRLTDSVHTHTQYPFKFCLEVSYTLQQNAVETVYHVINTDEKEIFFSIGAHDTYAITQNYEDYTIEFEQEEVFENGRIMNSTSHKSPAEEFTFPAAAKAFPICTAADKNRTVTFFLKNVQSSWVQLNCKGKPVARMHFDREKTSSLGFWNMRNSGFYCIEPWAGISELFQETEILTEKKNIHCLAPGEEFTYPHKVEWFLD